MPRRKELTGQRFGKLTVTERTDRTDRTKGRYVVWRCQCDCGGEILADTRELSRGTVKDCGCVKQETARRGSIAEDLTGKSFLLFSAELEVRNRKI